MEEKAKIGILMLDTTFHRPRGDIGNQDTFSFPVRYKKVEGASPTRVVVEKDATLIEPFVEAAQELEKEGIQAITTSCGFLAIFQKEIQSRLGIPFFSSSLLQIPLAHTMAGGPVGVLTASKTNLTDAHVNGVGADPHQVIIKGMDDKPAFAGAIMKQERELDQEAVKKEMQEVTTELITEHPDIKAIVLECTNMPPYQEAMREVVDVPIFDITTLVKYIHSSL
ncbi:aspartate/glutamate racemase family protein [Alteribacillus iranensis]|uniref:Asp/Glu/Hydantoin racemase n=1 Tax=Alteribacillus iranensis TaxID=930128 RepID=A0A1I2BMY7_9BACI|nr:aspartate/glutamate racemase family protein [Alteribacillus iranensis]SFE56590.1 Asp/Glu/Hydantoin racemase [Alteribacillus iranensis]